MSRTTAQDILENPSKFFAKWSTIKETLIVDGDEVEKIKGGTFVYFDKSKGENGEKVPMKLPLKFAILNLDLVSFKGYDEANKAGVWSNEVSGKDQLVIVRSKEGKLLDFKRSEYKLVKDKLASFGAKFTSSIYIGFQDEQGEWQIGNLQLSGSALSGAPNDAMKPTEEEREEGWFNFTKNHRSKLYTNFVEVNSYRPKKKGQSKFVIPIYELGDVIDDEIGQKLNELDEKLKEYLAFYFNKPVEEVVAKKDEELQDVTDY